MAALGLAVGAISPTGGNGKQRGAYLPDGEVAAPKIKKRKPAAEPAPVEATRVSRRIRGETAPNSPPPPVKSVKGPDGDDDVDTNKRGARRGEAVQVDIRLTLG